MYKNGLVLEGGGTRAVFTSGVLDCFLDNKIEFPYVIGVSAGTCNAVSYISKSYRRQIDITLNYVNDKRYMSVENFILKGEYLNYDWIFDELSYDLMPLDQDVFDNANCHFVSVVTSAETGKAEYLTVPNVHERGCVELRASCSLPIATKGTEIDGKLYFDGGIADSIPAKKALDDGCEKILVILTQDANYIKKPMDKIAPILRKKYKKYPKLADAILDRHNMYNGQLEYIKKLEDDGKAYVIRPTHPLHCSTLEKNKEILSSIYQDGYDVAKKSIEEIREFLK